MNRRSALAAVGAGALGPMLGRRASAADPAVLRLAAPPTDSSAEYYYADAEGFFKKAGFNVEISNLANGESVAAAVIGGSLDIGVSQAISIAAAFARGVPITVITGSGINDARIAPGTAGTMFVAQNSTIASGKDLIGKTVGVQGLHGFAQYGSQFWIDKTGGDSSQTKFVEMTSPLMTKALVDGRIDAAFIPEPFVAETAKVAKRIATPMDVIAPAFYQGVHFCMLSYAKANPDIVKRFESVMYETAAWANKNHDQTATILSDAAHIDIASVRGAVRSIYATRRDPALMQPMIGLAVKYGGIKPYSADDLFFKA